MSELSICRAHVAFWDSARQKAEDAWLGYQGEKAHKKEQLRRAYEFADRVLLGWEQKLAIAELKRDGKPLLRLVGAA